VLSYVRVRSWHRIDYVDEEQTVALTRCGRHLLLEGRQTADTLPLAEPSCETCLRLADRDDDALSGEPALAEQT